MPGMTRQNASDLSSELNCRDIWWRAHDQMAADRSQPLDCPLRDRNLTLDRCSWKTDAVEFTECPTAEPAENHYSRLPVTPSSVGAAWSEMGLQEVLYLYRTLLQQRSAESPNANMNVSSWIRVSAAEVLPFRSLVRIGVAKPLKNKKLNGEVGVALGWSVVGKSYFVKLAHKSKRKNRALSKVPLGSLEWNGRIDLGNDGDFDWQRHVKEAANFAFDEHASAAIRTLAAATYLPGR